MITRWQSQAAASLLVVTFTLPLHAAQISGSGSSPQERGTLSGRVSPPIAGTRILIQPREGRQLVAIGVGEDGSYRVTLPAGDYDVLPSVKGYELAGDVPGYGPRVSVRVGEETVVPDFELAETGILVGRVLDADPGTAVLARKRSLNLPEYERFWRKAKVSPIDGRYYLEGLRPGAYDLHIYSPTKGMMIVRQPLVGHDTLGDPDRASIRALEANLADAIRNADGDRVLAFHTTDYRTPSGYTYQEMKREYDDLKVHPERWTLPADKAPPNAKEILVDWKRSVLVLQGSDDRAVGIVHQTEQLLLQNLREPGLPARPEREDRDLLVTYRRTDGAWKIASQEDMRSYRTIQGGIALATERPPEKMKPLPEDFIIKYVLEADIESLTVYSRKVTTAHDYTLAAEPHS